MSFMPVTPAMLEMEIQDRLGTMPNFFRCTAENMQAVQSFWSFAKAAYLDNPLPSLFKQRLMVHLFRFSSDRYWAVRHVGFLLGYGFPAGDSKVEPHTLTEVIALLRQPAPTAEEVRAAVASLESDTPVPVDMPVPAATGEAHLFQAAAALFLQPHGSEQAGNALLHALGQKRNDALLQLLAFAQAAHTWTLTHPGIVIEHELQTMLERHGELAALLGDSAAVQSSQAHASSKAQARETRAQQASAREAWNDNKFVALAAHELRNPLAAISAASEVFQLSDLSNPRLRKASDILQRQIESMRHILDTLVDISRIARGDASISKTRVALNQVLNELVLEQASRLQETGIVLKSELPVAPAYVLGDSNRLRQLFGGLLSYAAQSIKGAGTLSINMSIATNRVTVRMIDSGPGVEGALADSLFRLPGSTDGRTGHAPKLELMLSKMLADVHDASLDAFSSGPGKGTTTIFSMPLHMPAASSTRNSERETMTSKSTMKVLVIEDNRDLAKLFCDLLEVMGCVPEVALNAKSGMDSAKKHVPDIVFCDLGLPGEKNGFDFAQDLRATPELSGIPLIAVTGHSSEEDQRRAIAAGFDRVFAKPIKFAEIQEVLNTFQMRSRQTKQ